MMSVFMAIALLVLFVWVSALELRHNGIKGAVADSKALASKAAKDARAALASVGVKRK
jgi:hypothetical protein